MRTIIALSVLFSPAAFAQLEILPPAQQAAQAGAASGSSTPVDASLSCDQLQTELVAVAQSPAFQNFTSTTGAAAANVQSQIMAAAQGAGVAVPGEAVAPPPAEEPKKKGGLFKKLGQAGQLAGAAASLGGLGGRGGAFGAAAAASQVASAAGAVGASDTASAVGAAGAVASAAGMAGSSADIGGLAGASGVLNAASGLGGIAGALGGGRAAGVSVAAAGIGAAAHTAGPSVGDPAAMAAVAPDMMRGVQIMELAKSKNCAWAAGQ